MLLNKRLPFREKVQGNPASRLPSFIWFAIQIHIKLSTAISITLCLLNNLIFPVRKGFTG